MSIKFRVPHIDQLQNYPWVENLAVQHAAQDKLLLASHRVVLSTLPYGYDARCWLE